jgi:hypothetical protein
MESINKLTHVIFSKMVQNNSLEQMGVSSINDARIIEYPYGGKS